MSTPALLSNLQARHIWMMAQRLDTRAPFGEGPAATVRAVEHLGYVQIDTINVIERCHHHILYSRIPSYQRPHLHKAQSDDKSLFEYWTHALSYVPTRDYRFFVAAMRRYRKTPASWFRSVSEQDVRKVIATVRKTGALSIRDIDDDVLVEKDHAWASRKPSRRALQLAFFTGALTVSRRSGMLKTYDLSKRHFEWKQTPRAASEAETVGYLLDRALRAQGLVSLDSICHLDAPRKSAVLRLIERRVRRKELLEVTFPGAGKVQHWIAPQTLDEPVSIDGSLVHILSPFDPLIIQRKRLRLMFDYDHRFEAYVPKDKRVLGYFALPVLVGDEIVAAIDMKTDRQKNKLLVQRWTWVGNGASKAHKRVIEDELHRFGQFQLA